MNPMVINACQDLEKALLDEAHIVQCNVAFVKLVIINDFSYKPADHFPDL